MRLSPSILLCVLSLAAVGCGEDVPERAVERDTPAITSPGTDLSYEQGGADGSGADGTEKSNERGGIAAGPDNPDPGESSGGDEEIAPPRGPQSE